jgi:O-antigen ligase|tara:strand:+ start:4471 stop:5697 length:1227 start_codon:yes stop_codon:yes gene_type:complete
MWWFLGMEQFLWFFAIGIIFIQFLIFNKLQFRTNTITLLLAFFLVAYGISFFSIVEKIRYITYFRNLSTYLTALMLLIITWNVIDKWWQVEKLLKAVIVVMLIASIVGILGFSFEIFRIQFKSLTGYFLPNAISKTGYGSVIAVRNIGFYNWFMGIGNYFRISSFFLYSTMFSSTLAITLPIALFLSNINKGRVKKFYVFSAVMMGLALLFTTGRVAIMAFFIGYVIFRFLMIKSFAKKIIIFGIFFMMSSIFLLYLELTGFLYQIIDLLLYSRGQGSANSRIKIYTQTFSSFLERPIFGWGTERDVKGLAYPMGSHSYYLGTLYKQGIVGLSLFISIFILIWNKLKVKTNLDNNFTRFFKYGQFLMLVYFINSFTDVLDLDATTMFFLWLILSLLIVSKRIYITKGN